MVDGRLTWSGYQLPAVRAARPAKVFGRARLIGKIYYLPETHVPLELERLVRLTSDLKGVLETAREQDPL